MGVLTDAIGKLAGEEDGNAPPEYFSSGPRGVTVTDEWREFEFDGVASSVAVRADQPILISFERPWGNPSAHIPLAENETPFSMGDSEDPVGSETLWAKRGEDATVDASVKVTAQYDG